MDESKDIATSFRYVLDLEAQMEQQRLEAEAEVASPPVASGSRAPAEGSSSTAARVNRSPKVQRSAIKHSATKEQSPSPKDKAKESTTDEHQEGGGKGKRKVTFDVQPEVAIIKDEGEVSSEQPTPSEVNEGWCILSPTKRTW